MDNLRAKTKTEKEGDMLAVVPFLEGEGCHAFPWQGALAVETQHIKAFTPGTDPILLHLPPKNTSGICLHFKYQSSKTLVTQTCTCCTQKILRREAQSVLICISFSPLGRLFVFGGGVTFLHGLVSGRALPFLGSGNYITPPPPCLLALFPKRRREPLLSSLSPLYLYTAGSQKHGLRQGGT